MLTVLAVSDATGETAERVVQAALAQFEDAPVQVLRRGHVRTPEQVRAVVEEAMSDKCIIVHTLVSTELRQQMLAESRLHGVDAMDLMGPLLDRLVTHLHLTPQQKPGLLAQLLEAKSRQIEAVDFAFGHDDGHNAEDLRHAEIVLVGISRTMKTPTMLYLAYRGWFAGNVPLVMEVAPPASLFSIPSERVFCLLMAPERLLELRRARALFGKIPPEPYASPQYVRKEITYCERLCLEHRWRRVDVTGKSVEEVGQEIIALRGGKTPPQRRG